MSSRLPGHLLLLVAEWAGFAEIQALRATCKTNRELLDKYEHAVTKANVTRYPCAPCSHMLASDTCEREVLPCNTFDKIRELETRERNIEHLMHSEHLAFWEEDDLQEESKAPLICANLKRALWQCSSLADLETHSFRYGEGVSPRRNHGVKSLIHQDIILRNAPPPDGWHFALEEVHESNRQDVRYRQIDYIRALSAEELAGIVLLAHLTSEGYMRRRWPVTGTSTPNVVEVGVCMAENAVRHGVFFLHSKLFGNEEADDHSRLLLDEAHSEMRRWEDGDPSALPGLTMTASSMFCEKVGCEFKDGLRAACTLVKGCVWKVDQGTEPGPEPEREKPSGEDGDTGEVN